MQDLDEYITHTFYCVNIIYYETIILFNNLYVGICPIIDENTRIIVINIQLHSFRFYDRFTVIKRQICPTVIV